MLGTLGYPWWVALGTAASPPPGRGLGAGQLGVVLGGGLRIILPPSSGLCRPPLSLCQEGWEPLVRQGWGRLSLGWCSATQKATQGLISAPAVLAGRGFFFFCAVAVANEVGNFSRKPQPCCTWSSPAAVRDGSQSLGGRRGVLQSSPVSCPSPVPKPFLG